MAVVNKVALGQVFLQVVWVCPGSLASYHSPYSYVIHIPFMRGTAVAQWLRCCATNRKVAGLIRAGVSGFFIDIKPFRSHYGPGVD